MKISKTLLVICFLIFPRLMSADVPAPNYYYEIHYMGVKTLWDARMGYYTPQELADFAKATWQGTDGNVKICKALAGISILECKPAEAQVPVRNRTGHLGGHRTTIRVGAREAHIAYSTPYLRTQALSHHFLVLYYRFHGNLEKTCRVWNMGPKWRNGKATRYWNGVLAFSKIYERPLAR